MDGQNLNISRRIRNLATAQISAGTVTGIAFGFLLMAAGLTLFAVNVFTSSGINIGPTPT